MKPNHPVPVPLPNDKVGKQETSRFELIDPLDRRVFALALAVLFGSINLTRAQISELLPVSSFGQRVSLWHDRTPAIDPTSSLPAAAEDCAMIYDPVEHRIVLFGGKDDRDQNQNEVWAFDLRQSAWSWMEVEGERPPASEDHAVVFDPLGYRMILHGGENGPTWNQTWALDLKSHRWRNMTDSTAPAREDHSAIYDSRGKRMVIFGGRDRDYINIYEIWALDLNPDSPTFERWQNLTVEEKHPPGRSDHVAVYDPFRERMIVYGGWDKEEKDYFGDTWAFFFGSPPESLARWRQLKTKKSHPPKRRHTVGALDFERNWFVICGGFGEEGYLNDVWAFDLATNVWMNITPGPRPRMDHQMIYDPLNHNMILWGGDARLKTKFHDMWMLEILPQAVEDSLEQIPESTLSEKH